MIDFNMLFKNPDVFIKLLLKKKFVLNINMLIQKRNYCKLLKIKIQKLQFKRNYFSKLISLIKFNSKNINMLILKVIKLNRNLNKIKKLFLKFQNDINNYLLSIPNITANDVPFGLNKKDNIEIFRWGKIKKFNFLIKNHIELGNINNELDFTSAVKLTGSRFVVMSGKIAKLHRALIQFMLDFHILNHGYKEYYLPYLVNQSSLYGTGQLPFFINDLFYVNLFNKNYINNKYVLIPTAEVPLINLMRNKIIDEDLLPFKMVSHTPCFRSETGSYGLDTRGLSRLHQFDKVELVQFVKPENSNFALEEITNHAEKILQLLDLPYRKMLLCTGDTGFSSYKTYDLEVWLPSINGYKEISSCSNTSDFQSRRMFIRYRRKHDKKKIFLNILNASGLAVGRTLMALLENNQLVNGFIKIPNILKPYIK